MSDVINQGSSNPSALGRFDGYVYCDDRGAARYSIGLVVMLYYFDGTSDAKLAASRRVLADFLRRFPGSINGFMPLNARKRRKGNVGDIVRYYDATLANPRTRLGAIEVFNERDGRVYGEPQQHYLEVAPGPAEAKVSQLVCYLPAGWLEAAGTAAFVELVALYASELQVAHGTAGLGLQFNQANSHGAADTILPVLKRHPGLDVGDRHQWSLEIGRHAEQRMIRTTGWLTVIDDAFAKTLGGEAAIAHQIGPQCPIHPYDGGIVIQAGPMPHAGDRNQNMIPEHYKAVSTALKPLRLEEFSGFGFFQVPSTTSRERIRESAVWVRRFD